MNQDQHLPSAQPRNLNEELNPWGKTNLLTNP